MKFRNLTLRTRIYLSMLAILLVSFLASGALATYEHYEKAAEDNVELLQEKEDDVRHSLEYILEESGGIITTDSLFPKLSDRICELSSVHQMLTTFFDLRGRYIISSNPDRLDSLGISSQLNFSVMKQLSTGNQRTLGNTQSFTDTTLVDKKITLVYWYYNDLGGKPIAIVNTAYSIPPVDSHKLVEFLWELGQTYILLFLLAAVVAYLLSRYITRTLQLIEKKLQQVQFGKKNEPLEWEGHDEIGRLVNEYNRMLTELESSAKLLAQTERESAWREMAQQVAHEIKNPLTPMKLRVQHLLRSWQDNPSDFEKRLGAFSQTMTEQIDTLSKIASEFSHFAKMPKPQLQSLDLKLIIESVVELYHENGRAKIQLRCYGVNGFNAMADKDQVLRIMNNLLNNALQSIPENRSGKIDLVLRGSEKFVLVRINDNGSGIPKDKHSKIFVPN